MYESRTLLYMTAASQSLTFGSPTPDTRNSSYSTKLSIYGQFVWLCLPSLCVMSVFNQDFLSLKNCVVYDWDLDEVHITFGKVMQKTSQFQRVPMVFLVRVNHYLFHLPVNPLIYTYIILFRVPWRLKCILAVSVHNTVHTFLSLKFLKFTTKVYNISTVWGYFFFHFFLDPFKPKWEETHWLWVSIQI